MTVALSLSSIEIPSDFMLFPPRSRWEFLYRELMGIAEDKYPETTTIQKYTGIVSALLTAPIEWFGYRERSMWSASLIERLQQPTPFSIGDILPEIGDAIVEGLSSLGRGIKSVFGSVWGAVKDAISWVKDHFSEILLMVAVFQMMPNSVIGSFLGTIPGINRLRSAVGTIAARARDAYFKIKPVIDKSKALLQSHTVQTLIKTGTAIHNLGLIFVPSYARAINEFMNGTSRLSAAVFGDVREIRAQMALMQMAVYDASSIAGEPIHLAESRFWKYTFEMVENVERHADTYQNFPFAFWRAVQGNWVQPEYEKASKIMLERESLMGKVVRGVVETNRRVQDVDKRFLEYQDVLKPLVDADVIVKMDQFRFDVIKNVAAPLRELSDDYKRTFEIVDKKQIELQGKLDTVSVTVEHNRKLLTEPANLTDEGRKAQLARFGSIFDNLSAHSVGNETSRINAARYRITSIFDELRKE